MATEREPLGIRLPQAANDSLQATILLLRTSPFGRSETDANAVIAICVGGQNNGVPPNTSKSPNPSQSCRPKPLAGRADTGALRSRHNKRHRHALFTATRLAFCR